MLLLRLLVSAALLSATHATLQLAVVIFRHGHRNIAFPYRFDPYRNDSYWPGGIGQITKRGKMQMYHFGQQLRERYSDLLSDQYNAGEILVRSSSSPRCINSALCVLAGLFPPTGDEVWNPGLLWQPVPIYATRKICDSMMESHRACPAYLEEFKQQKNAPDVRAFNSNHSDVYHIVSEKWKPVFDFEAPSNLYDYFKLEEERGFKPPNWTNTLYPDKLREIAIMYQTFMTRTPLMKRLKMGPLVKETVQRMIAKRNGTMRGKRKLLLFSGHEDTITGMLSVLDQPNEFVVQHGAALFIELHANMTGQHEVKMFFMPDTDLKDIQDVHLPLCGRVCELDTFVQIMSPVIPLDWDKECQLNSTAAR